MLVIAHYFPLFRLSIDNHPSRTDYYATQFLRAEGEGGKFAKQRGFLRDRPLPTAVKPESRAAAANLAIEVARAARIGIDAFGVNLLGLRSGDTNWETALRLLDAAQAADTGLKIVPEPDMVALRGVAAKDLSDALASFAGHPASYHLPDGRLLVMPFGAEAREPAFYRAVAAAMTARGTPIAWLPTFLDPKLAGAYAADAWGASLWGDRDPRAGAVAVAAARRAAGFGIRRFILPVAPQDFRPKDMLFWEARNSEAFRAQWQAAIASRPFGVQLVTWNDYSESSHVAPSLFTQFGFYDLAAYYISWGKRGAPPPILRDALYLFARRQIVKPDAPERGPMLRQQGATPLANDVEVVALLTAPARLVLRAGGREIVRDVPAGLQTLRLPAAPGRFEAQALRGGRVVVAQQSGWAIEATAWRHDATYGSQSSARRRVAIGPAAD